MKILIFMIKWYSFLVLLNVDDALSNVLQGYSLLRQHMIVNIQLGCYIPPRDIVLGKHDFFRSHYLSILP